MYAVGTEPQKVICNLLFYPNTSGIHTIVSSPLTSAEAFSIEAKAVSMSRAKKFPPMIAECNSMGDKLTAESIWELLFCISRKKAVTFPEFGGVFSHKLPIRTKKTSKFL